MATAEELKKIYDTQAAGAGNPSTPVSGGSVGVAANGAQGNVGATLGAAAIPAAGAAQGNGAVPTTVPTAPAAQSVQAPGAINTADRANEISAIYDAQREARLAELQSAYDQSQSGYQAAADKIAPQYQNQANDLAVQYERNRRNFNQQALDSGLNTGTGSQAELAQNSEYQRDFGSLRTAQANAVAETDRQMANLTAQYQSDIKAALAGNDYQKAAALLDEYNNGYNRDLKNAQVLAEFGDFTGFAAIYGQEQAAGMAKIWTAQNPDLAYNTGRITAEEYKGMTGQYPAGYSAPSSGGGYYGGGSYRDESIVASPTSPDRTVIGQNGKSQTINNYGEVRLGSGPTRGEAARAAAQARANNEISIAEYNNLIRALH